MKQKTVGKESESETHVKKKAVWKEYATPTQLIKIAKARYLAGVTIFKLLLCCHA